MSTYSKLSPYSNTPLQGGAYLDTMVFRNIPAQASDVPWEITPPYMHRPDLLAFDLYGDVSYWWVFAVRNRSILKDPIYDLVPGRTIYIPQADTIRSALG
jgi:hypothetical protein